MTSDAARNQAIDVINTSLTKGGLNAVADTMRRAVGNRMREFVGSNRYLRKQNPDLVAPPGATGVAPGPDGRLYFHDAQGKSIEPLVQ